jgi:Tfp pilus assembly protein PilN
MFSKKSESSSPIKNVVTLNVFSQKNYIFKSDTFQPLKKLTFNTNNFITSYVTSKDLISTKVSVSRNIPEEDIEDILDIKAYEELGLDQAGSYTISNYEVDSGKEEREFHIFVAEPEDLDNLFLPVKLETKYLDLIIPSPLLYRPLYTKEILQDNSIHCFVYFTHDDATVTIYQEGEYLYTKSIDFSLEQIYDKYCEYIGEKVDEKEFFSKLESEGLKTSDPDYQQNFMKIFGEIFITINDIIIYAKRAFELGKIDQMFIGSSRGPIMGLDEYSENYLGLLSSDFNFNYNVNNEEWYTDQYQYLMLLASHEYMEDESAFVNLTMYPRPPSFVNRASGQFIISVFGAISLSLAYPLVFLVGSYANDATIYALNIENDSLTAESVKYKGILSKKREVINSLDETIKDVSSRYSAKTKTLKAIYDKKINYRLKSGLFHTIAEQLHRFDVHIDSLESHGDTIEVNLVSTDDRKFTELIRYISETHFKSVKSIDIKTIEKNPENGYYKGLLKVVR